MLGDGTRLHTVLLLPEGEGPWPALLLRHPYDVAGDEVAGMVDVARLTAAGYLVALQDVRGRFGSDGAFDPCAQEAADGAEAVAWLAARAECTGAVGMWGGSYASDTQYAALLGGAEVKAVAPAISPALSAFDGFRFRGGVPDIGSTLAWTHYAIAPHEIARVPDADRRAARQERWEATERAIADGSAYRAGALSERPDVEPIVAWGLDRLRAPLDAAIQRVGKIGDRIGAVAVPALVIGGWFDVFLGSTLELHRRLAEAARTTGSPAPRLIIGPWSHASMGSEIAGVDFGPTAAADHLWGDGDLTTQHVRWFDGALRGSPLPGAPVQVFVMGANRWLALEEFPPPFARTVELLLGADGAISTTPAAGDRTLVSDPHDPVPTRGGAVLLFGGFDAGPADQRVIEARSDVMSWRTEPLTADVTVVGAVRAVVHLSTTGTDADVVVRLSDEHPDGSVRVIADGVQRGSARGVDSVTGHGERRPLTPGRDEEFEVDLWATAHTFARGHRLRVDIAPSSSPRWEVGTNSCGPTGEPGEPQVATWTIRHGGAHPTRLIVQTVDL